MKNVTLTAAVTMVGEGGVIIKEGLLYRACIR